MRTEVDLSRHGNLNKGPGLPAAQPSQEALPKKTSAVGKLGDDPKAHRENRTCGSAGGAGGGTLDVFLPQQHHGHTHHNKPHKHSCRTCSMEHSRVNAVICCYGDELLSEGVHGSLSLEVGLREFKRFTELESRV